MHPSPLPHQTPSLSPPLPDCGAPNDDSRQEHRKRGKHKVRKGVQKPQQHNSKQVEHHLRHKGPSGSVNWESADFHWYCFSLEFSTSLPWWHQVRILSILSVTNESEYVLYVPRERMVTITMATLLSARHKVILFTTTQRAVWPTLPCTSVRQ